MPARQTTRRWQARSELLSCRAMAHLLKRQCSGAVLATWYIGWKKYFEKRLIKEKRRANIELGRECLLDERCYVGVLSRSRTCLQGSREWKAEPKESAPRSRGKACCYLSSGTEEEMRGSSGRIRDQRMRPALEGLKATGRNRRASTHRSPLARIPCQNASLAETICWSTWNALPLPQLEMIRSPRPLTIRCLCLCLAILKLSLILARRSRPPHGQPCSSGSSRGSRSVTSHMIMACRMRRSGVYCGPLVAAKWYVWTQMSHVASISHTVPA